MGSLCLRRTKDSKGEDGQPLVRLPTKSYFSVEVVLNPEERAVYQEWEVSYRAILLYLTVSSYLQLPPFWECALPPGKPIPVYSNAITHCGLFCLFRTFLCRDPNLCELLVSLIAHALYHTRLYIEYVETYKSQRSQGIRP